MVGMMHGHSNVAADWLLSTLWSRGFTQVYEGTVHIRVMNTVG